MMKEKVSMLCKETTLSLNANWCPCGFKTGQEAICTMMGGDNKNPPALGVNIDYAIDENGSIDFGTVTNITMYAWTDWVKLPVRPHDFGVKTVNGEIRIPTVIIHPKFKTQIRKKKRYTKSNIFERDGWTCQYTGMKLTRATATIDHVVPRSKGGKTSWENCVASHKDINNKKGDKMNHEIGLKLIKKPVQPEGSDFYHEVVNRHTIRMNDWNYFLKSFEKD